jgi:hypothetical protein
MHIYNLEPSCLLASCLLATYLLATYLLATMIRSNHLELDSTTKRSLPQPSTAS